MFGIKYNTIIGTYGPKKCRHNVPYELTPYDYKKEGKEEAYEDIANRFNVFNDFLTSYLNVTCGNYCDVSPQYRENNFDLKLLIGDIPHQNNLPHASKLCGYVEIDGTYHKCDSCEHENIIRQIVWENEDIRKRYFETKASFFDQMPRGMLQEEYFAMKQLGFVKISSFKDTPTQMIVFFYGNLTYKQSDLIYPR